MKFIRMIQILMLKYTGFNIHFLVWEFLSTFKAVFPRSNAIWCEIEWHPKMALQDNFLPAQTELSLSTTMGITTAAIAASAK